MNTMLKHITAMAQKAGKVYSKEDESLINEYLKGKAEFDAIEPMLFKLDADANNDDYVAIDSIGKSYRKGSIDAGSIARYFKLFYHIRGCYYYLSQLSRTADIGIKEMYTLFDLNRSELLKYYCTHNTFLPNPHNNAYHNPCPLVRLFRHYSGQSLKLIPMKRTFRRCQRAGVWRSSS